MTITGEAKQYETDLSNKNSLLLHQAVTSVEIFSILVIVK